jgi:hypothetical protein
MPRAPTPKGLMARLRQGGAVALEALESLAHIIKEKRSSFGERGVLTAIVHVLREGESLEHISWACWAAGTLACDDKGGDISRMLEQDGAVHLVVQALDDHPQVLAIQRDGFLALCNILGKLDAVDEALGERICGLIFRVLEEIPPPEGCLIHKLAFSTAGNLISSCALVKRELLQGRRRPGLLLQRIGELLPTYRRAGFELLGALVSDNPAHQETIGAAGGCDMLLRAIEQKTGHGGLLASALWAVGDLAEGHPANQERLLRAGACEVVLHGLEGRTKTGEVAGAFRALLALLDHPECLQRLREVAAWNVVVPALRAVGRRGQGPRGASGGDELLDTALENGCRVVLLLAKDDVASRAAICHTEACEAIVNVLEGAQWGARAVAETGWCALEELAGASFVNQDYIRHAGGCGLIVRFLRATLTPEPEPEPEPGSGSQYLIILLNALENVVLRHPENQASCVEAGACVTLLRLLERHQEDAETVGEILDAINAVVDNHRRNQVTMVASGGIEPMLRVGMRHAGDVHVAEILLNSLHFLCRGASEGQLAEVDPPVVEFVVSAMATSPKDLHTQTNGAAVLSIITGKLKNPGFLCASWAEVWAAITTAWRAFPQDEDIQENASETVASMLRLQLVSHEVAINARVRTLSEEASAAFPQNASIAAARDAIVTSLGMVDSRQIPFGKIQAATRDFDGQLVIGQGGFGRVYRGRLDGQDVAVKVIGGLNLTTEQREAAKRTFLNEIQTLERCKHENIVRLLAYGLDDTRGQVGLVYELMEGGTLSDRLHGKDQGAGPGAPLTPLQR